MTDSDSRVTGDVLRLARLASEAWQAYRALLLDGNVGPEEMAAALLASKEADAELRRCFVKARRE